MLSRYEWVTWSHRGISQRNRVQIDAHGSFRFGRLGVSKNQQLGKAVSHVQLNGHVIEKSE